MNLFKLFQLAKKINFNFNNKILLRLSFLLFYFLNASAQNTFDLIKEKKKEKISFKLINNLVLIPVELNGENLTFMVDTGVKQSLLFSITSIDSISLNQVEKVRIKGLGEDKYFDALKSKNNLLRIDDVVCPDFEILVILDKKFDFSTRMGINIHGIIGSELFKDFIIEIDYQNKKISFNKPKTYTYKRCKKCQEFPLTFRFQKPYINTIISRTDSTTTKAKLLIDSGSGDALWLFEKSSTEIEIPKKSMQDFLGKGLSGNIYGKKGKLASLEIGKFKFCNMLVAYPDSTSILGGEHSFRRNGILGSEILKRFHTIYDYPNKKITFKKNKYYRKKFYYDKSGLDIIYNGKVLVKELESTFSYGMSNAKSTDTNDIITYTYNYIFENSYIIALVKPDSVAGKAGLLKDDIILKINGTPAYRYTLQQITQKMSGKDGTSIRLLIKRRGMQYTFKFTLKDFL